MKHIAALLLIAFSLAAQPRGTVVGRWQYSELPFGIRTANSGIYSMSALDVSNGSISITSVDDRGLYRLQTDHSFKRSSESDQTAISAGSIKCFAGNSYRSFTAIGGSYKDRSGEGASVRISGRSLLTVTTRLQAVSKECRLTFSNDLAYADLIGIDAAGHIFILTERYISEIPLHVQREVLTLDAEGRMLSVLQIPDIKYCSTDRDFQIDAAGNLYHMMTTREALLIFKWSGLAGDSFTRIEYPSEYHYSLHFNNELPQDEPILPPADAPLALTNRATALRIGESYATHQYSCTSANLAPANVTGPDGDVVRTSPWLLVGTNARVPYMWGGYSTIVQFDDGLKAGKYAGDINTAGVSSSAVGVDCSGFVSRCWQTGHNSTSSMPGITTQYASWDSLKPGDAIHKIGHVRLFVERTPNGGFRVVEAAGRNWDVSYWTYAASDLEGVYTPRCFNNMESNYSAQRPILVSSVTGTGGMIELVWQSDTTNVLGYRLYRSVDGNQWSLLQNETVLGKVGRTFVASSVDAEYYRIASVKNDVSKTESDWSNAMGASRIRGASHYLIVDGFERQNGSWQGPGHLFADRYGLALNKAGVTFSTMKNSEILRGTFSIQSYDGVIWFLGDEGAELETFSISEQNLVQFYLQQGKKLLVTGSEVGWDLAAGGTATDKAFYAEYLKALYKADNAGSIIAQGVAGGIFDGPAFNLGQIYVEDYPDEIDAANGSTVCIRYANGKAAGIQYSGPFGSSSQSSKLLYLSFALETTANDSAFVRIIKSAVDFFENRPNGVATENTPPQTFALEQNYPNPFNPSTVIRFSNPGQQYVTLTIYNSVGAEVAKPVCGILAAGQHAVRWDANRLSTGAYFAVLRSGESSTVRKMLLVH